MTGEMEVLYGLVGKEREREGEAVTEERMEWCIYIYVHTRVDEGVDMGGNEMLVRIERNEEEGRVGAEG